MNLHDFLTKKTNRFAIELEHPDFERLYVQRIGRTIEGIRYDDVITICNVSAWRTGCGCFTRLVEMIVEHDYCVYVENVQTSLFRDGLVRLGFRQVHSRWGHVNMFLSND